MSDDLELESLEANQWNEENAQSNYHDTNYFLIFVIFFSVILGIFFGFQEISLIQQIKTCSFFFLEACLIYAADHFFDFSQEISNLCITIQCFFIVLAVTDIAVCFCLVSI